VLLSINVQIFDLPQEIIIVGNICGEGSCYYADIVEAQATGYGELSGSRESNNPAQSVEQKSHFRATLPDLFRPNMADSDARGYGVQAILATGQFGHSLRQRGFTFHVSFSRF
jgi:hypothetical protein